MNETLQLILLIAAFVCFVAAALGVTWRSIAFVPLGLALWVLTVILA